MQTETLPTLSERLSFTERPQTAADFADYVDTLMTEVNSLSVNMGKHGIGGDPGAPDTIRHDLLRAFGSLYDARQQLRAA